jgi:pimeloyl-ACP methyl ester carboxylesterase
MREWFSGYVNTNGMRMHYYRTRGDKPPLVLAHGATDSGLCWSRLARTLESEYDVILPDARGHGFRCTLEWLHRQRPRRRPCGPHRRPRPQAYGRRGTLDGRGRGFAPGLKRNSSPGRVQRSR